MAKRQASKRGGKRSKARRRHGQLLDSSLLLTMGDELDRAEALLEMVPDLTHTGNLIRDEMESPGRSGDDELAQCVRESLGLELGTMMEDESGESPLANLRDARNAADVVLDAARWRLRRLKRLLSVTARASH